MKITEVKEWTTIYLTKDAKDKLEEIKRLVEQDLGMEVSWGKFLVYIAEQYRRKRHGEME